VAEGPGETGVDGAVEGGACRLQAKQPTARSIATQACITPG